MTLLFFIFISLALKADVPGPILSSISFQQAPPHLRWQSFETDHFKFIYPTEISQKAHDLADYIETVYPLVSEGLGVYPEKIPLILQTEITASNAYVTLMPRRSEWVMRPYLQSPLNSVDWLKTLSLHEYRHVVQFQKSKQGFNKYLYYFLGELGQSIGVVLTFPNWFLEGDAVGVETFYTNGGRGRQPMFERDLKAIVLGGEKYRFDQAYLGSFKSYLPNHYVYGYFLTTWLKNKYGENIFDKLGSEAADTSYNPLTFYRRIEELEKSSFETVYENMMTDLKSLWLKNLNNEEHLPLMHVEDQGTWTNYLQPQMLSNGDVIAFKTGLGDILQLVRIHNKIEKTIYYPTGITEKIALRVKNDKLAFLEYQLDSRFQNSDYQRIVICDFKIDNCYPYYQTTKAKLVSLSPTADFISLVEIDSSLKQKIKIIRLENYQTVKEIVMDELVSSLDWLGEDELVLVTRKDESKKIIRLNIESENNVIIYESKGIENLGDVFVLQNKIIFESNKTGTDEIHFVNEKENYPVTESRFGSYHPSIQGDRIIFNRYQKEGMRIVEGELKKTVQNKTFQPFYLLDKKKNQPIVSYKANKTAEKKYPEKLSDRFNFHSWQILIPPFGSSVILSAQSTDLLAQNQLMAGYERNINEGTNSVFANYAFQKYDPIFDVSASIRERFIEYSNKKQERWHENTAGFGINLSRNYLHSRYLTQFKLSPRLNLISISSKETKLKKDLGNTNALNPKVVFKYSTLSKLTVKDLYPQLGLALSLQAEELRQKNLKSYHSSIQSLFYFPGLYKHHSFFHELSYEKQNPQNYEFLSQLLFSRGYRYTFYDEQTKLSMNYSLPLAYPEKSIGPYAYLKRLSLNGFYDYLSTNQSTLFRSYGGELLFEANFLRLPFTLKFGLRYSFLVDDQLKNNDVAFFLAPTSFNF